MLSHMSLRRTLESNSIISAAGTPEACIAATTEPALEPAMAFGLALVLHTVDFVALLAGPLGAQHHWIVVPNRDWLCHALHRAQFDAGEARWLLKKVEPSYQVAKATCIT